MRFRFVTILPIILAINSFSQQEYKLLSQRLLKADSVWIVNYALYDTTANIRRIIKNAHIDSILPKAIFRMGFKTKSEFASILERENSFVGRYGSKSGFSPRQAVLIWTTGYYTYFELYLSGHDL